MQDRSPIFSINEISQLNDEMTFDYPKTTSIDTFHNQAHTQAKIQTQVVAHRQTPDQTQILFPILNKETFSQQELPIKKSRIWEKIGEHLDLDHSAQNSRVQKEIRRILADKKSFEVILQRSAPYIHYIYLQTKQRHLPAEITLIPIIESEYNPQDHNRLGATGLWQLMPATAHIFGLKRDKGPRNVIESTTAALRFFTDLRNEFHGNWNLAFAAYNCGSGCVHSASRRAGSKNYFNLRLPLETKLYVPRLLAVAEIIKHSEKYGIVLPKTEDAPYFKKIKVNKSNNLVKYAKATGTDLSLLKKLNPDYKYISGSNTLLVPV